MKKAVRNILIVISAVVITIMLSWAYLAGNSARKPLVCKGLRVTIADSTTNSFISKADISRFLKEEYGTYKEVLLDNINLDKIEKMLEGKSAINKAEAFVTKDGMLNVSVTQRRPAVRFQSGNWGYYADAEGRSFPLQRSYASHVPVVDGNIPAMTDTVKIVRTTALVNFLEKSSTWKNKFVQIRINEKGDIILIPREGKERFIIGQPCKLEEKGEKMKMYYTHILPAKGEGHYKTIDLRFDGQIVCR